jgi:heme/copper-type cytochrome/quinol oxidase subunit 1
MNLLGSNLTDLPMFLAGFMGMPRHVTGYAPGFGLVSFLAGAWPAPNFGRIIGRFAEKPVAAE